MKKVIICLLIVVSASQYSCKKFLNITPIDKLTGNNFYKTADDMESNITDMYGMLFEKYTRTSFAGATGEFRSGEVIPAVQGGDVRQGTARLGGHTRQAPDPKGSTDKQTIPLTTVNDRLLLTEGLDRGKSWNVNAYNYWDITIWNEYYKVIQSANILVSKLEEGDNSLTEQQTKRYIAEAKFIRCFCYFTMVRLYGDVIYYTKAFQKDPLPRENMVSVINKCIADLKDNYKDLPITFTDPSQRGVRASQGAAIGLLMNMNMWNAGFDLPNRTNYWTETATLGEEIMSSRAFRLLPLSEWSTVAKGRSEESLFELFRTLNYNNDLNNPFEQAYAYSPFGDAFIHFPYKQPEYTHRYSFNVFTEEYMHKLYPTDETDGRLTVWFVAPFDQNPETFQLRKFALNTFIDANRPDLDLNPDNTYLIMRYSDAILLRAEALANLGGANEDAAIEALNEVRTRAGATTFSKGNGNLKDAIFWERAKELMGEGSRYFDLVRTRRIMSKLYTDNPLTSDKFNRGGWTWPIDASALTNNPYMTLNNYWIGTGL